MYSQCPECLTRFRVSAAALRAAHGTVRCGRCGSAFDALPRLSDTLQGDGASSDSGEPAPPGATAAGGMTGATAVGLLATGAGGSVAEFHFSADDIEQVFIDARDWQSRFGSSSSPGDRAGRLGDTSTAELVGFLKDGETGDEDEPERDANDPPVWVHEPESVEDITLEGERIQIEGVGNLDELAEDFLEREIAKEIEEQHRAEITGTHRGFDVAPDEAAADATGDGAIDALEPFEDLDSTDQFEILHDVPESGFPDQEHAPARAPNPEAIAEPIVPPGRMPAAVAATVAGIAGASTGVTRPVVEKPAVNPMAARWRRPVETDESFRLGDHDHDLADELAVAASARRSAWAWGIGALLLILVFTAQVTHHYRLQLARDTVVGPALREVYARIGMPLPPNWNLSAFKLRQWGASESAPTAAGTLTVRASLKNDARFAQPMPMLRLELEDRFGSTVARRDFEPAEYLKDPARATRLLYPGASTEAVLEIVGATTEAVGYRLDVCLRDENGVVRCAEPGGGSPAASQAPQ